jgi:hypothetical protein
MSRFGVGEMRKYANEEEYEPVLDDEERSEEEKELEEWEETLNELRRNPL